MYYSRESVDQVVSRTDIVDIIGSYIQLKKTGSNYMGVCPFHGDKGPSLSVSREKQLFHCFGCQEAGNVVGFVMKIENYDYQEAIRFLADKAGVKLVEEKGSVNNAHQQEKDKLYEIYKIAATYYVHVLRSEAGKAGLNYFLGRGLKPETITAYGLGYAPQNTGDLYRKLKDEKGFDDEILKLSGLFSYEKGVREKFWNRVIYPIMDERNRVVAFGGRVMGDGKPKYINSQESLIYHKSDVLYGMNVARKARTNNVIICEGYMDVISLHQAGFKQALASCGTALTESQVKTIVNRVSPNVYITFDSDEAGIKARLNAIGMFARAGARSRVVNLEPYKDPDEFIKALGVEEFQKRLDNAENSFLYEIRILERGFKRSEPDEETIFVHEVAKRLTRFSNRVERDNYIKAVANRFSIDYAGLRGEVASKGAGGIASSESDDYIVTPSMSDEQMKGIEQSGYAADMAAATATSPGRSAKKRKESGLRKSEKMLLTWMIEERAVYEEVSNFIAVSDFTDGLVRELAGKVYDQLERGQVNAGLILADFDVEDQAEIATFFNAELKESMSDKDRNQTLNDLVHNIKENSLKEQMDKMEKTGNREELMKLMNDYDKVASIHLSLFEK